MLDVIVERDGRCRWKDEDELEALVAHGLLDASVAERVRAEARRVATSAARYEPPFARQWDGWRPDPSWAPPELPEGWDRL